MGTATLVAANIGGYAGVANVYQVEPPLANNLWVTVFAVDMPGTQHDETVIVSAYPSGAAITMNRLPGSLVGWADHEKALRIAGYDVVIPPEPDPVEVVDTTVPPFEPDDAA
jgi:hypothetical protein